MTAATTGKRYDSRALTSLMARFESRFETFASQKYDESERGYKFQAAEQFRATLSQEQLEAHIAQGDLEQAKADISRLAQRPHKAPNKHITLFNQWDMQPLRETDAAVLVPQFAELLYGTRPFGRRFDAWVDLLGRVKGNCWPAATYFLMLHQPQEHIFVKAAPFKAFLKELDSSLDWQPHPTAAYYAQLQAFARGLLNDLRRMGARDMIDVQSFIWQTQLNSSAT